MHTTSFRTWALHLNNCTIRTGITAASTVDTLFWVNLRLTTLLYNDSSLRANLLTWMSSTALAHIGDNCLIVQTFVAGKFDDVNQRWLIVALCDRTLIYTICHWRMFSQCTVRQSNCKSKTLSDDGSLGKYALTKTCQLSRHNFIWKLLQTGIISAFVSKSCYFGEYFFTHICYIGVNSSDAHFILLLFASFLTYLLRSQYTRYTFQIQEKIDYTQIM